MGFGQWFNRPGFTVKKWIPVEEDFLDVSLSPEDTQRLTENYQEIRLYLGPYPKENHRDWVALTNLIAPHDVCRLLPVCGRVTSCTQFQSEPSSSQQRLAAKASEPLPTSIDNPEDRLPNLSVVPGTEIRFSEIPKRPLFPKNSLPVEITAHGIDQTFTLNYVLDSFISQHQQQQSAAIDAGDAEQKSNWRSTLSVPEQMLLAELQFSYVVFLLNHVLEGWYQWRRIVQLLASCEQATHDRPQLYLGLITVLYHQLCNASQSKEFLDSPSVDLSTAELADLFFLEAEDQNRSCGGQPAFLPSVMRRLLRNILCSSTNTAESSSHAKFYETLVQRAEGFCHSLEQRFHWGLKYEALRFASDEEDVTVDQVDWDGDEAPVIVL
ncbi:unnamed protein product [Dicrocoelium dendriticum]|nr:unnamed protein product [Dicrocoelium dendriticum]